MLKINPKASFIKKSKKSIPITASFCKENFDFKEKNVNEDKTVADEAEVFDKTDNSAQRSLLQYKNDTELSRTTARFFSNFVILGLELKRYLCYTIRVLRIDNAISIFFIIRIIL